MEQQPQKTSKIGSYIINGIILTAIGIGGKMQSDLMENVEAMRMDVATLLQANVYTEKRLMSFDGRIDNVNNKQEKDHTKIMMVYAILPKKFKVDDSEDEDK